MRIFFGILAIIVVIGALILGIVAAIASIPAVFWVLLVLIPVMIVAVLLFLNFPALIGVFTALILTAGLFHECGKEGGSQLSPFKAAAFATSNCGIGDAFTNTCRMSPNEQRERLFVRDPIDNGRTTTNRAITPSDPASTGNTGFFGKISQTIKTIFSPSSSKPVAGVDYDVEDLSLQQKAEVFKKVCQEEGLSGDCWQWLLAICQQESGCRQDAYNPELAKGDGFSSYGPFQIRVVLHQQRSSAPFNEVDLKCAYDFACSARWTVRELKTMDFPKQIIAPICRHNGATGENCSRYYNSVMAKKDSATRSL